MNMRIRFTVLVLAGLLAALLFTDWVAAEPTAGYARPESVAPTLSQSKPGSAAFAMLNAPVFPISPPASPNFQAQADNGVEPPATHGAVGGPGGIYVMSVHNGTFKIQTRTGSVSSTMTDAAFWALSGIAATGLFDPKVLYDPYNNRWILTELSDPRSPASSILIALSKTDDPSFTNWDRYSIDVDESDYWADSPGIGFNKNWIAIAVNLRANSDDAYYTGRAFIIDYVALRAATPPVLGSTVTTYGGYGPDYSFGMQPAVTYSALEPTLFLVTAYINSGYAYHIIYPITGTPDAPFVNPSDIKFEYNPLSPLVIPGGNILPQPDPGGGAPVRRIVSPDARIGNVVFRNDRLYYVQTVGLPGNSSTGMTHTAVQWLQLDRYGNVQQGGRIEDPGANQTNGLPWYAYPSIAVNACDDVLVGYSVFQSDAFASAGYSFRYASDPPDNLRDPTVLKAGEGYYDRGSVQNYNAWGPYSATVVDPLNDHDMWTIQEYAALPAGSNSGDGRWGTWWGRIEVANEDCHPLASSTSTPTPGPTDTPMNTFTPGPSPTPYPTHVPACGALDVAFILDDTGSMQGALNNIKDAFTGQIVPAIEEESGTAGYRLALVTFKDDIRVRAPFAYYNGGSVASQFSLTAGGGGNVPEASDEALYTAIWAKTAIDPDRLGHQTGDFTPGYDPSINVTKIAILVTDAVPGGFDDMFTSTDTMNAAQRAQEAHDKDILIVAIFVPTTSNEDAVPIMQDYADKTGGLYIRANSDGSGVAPGILAAIRNCGSVTGPATATATATGTGTSRAATSTGTGTPPATRTPLPTGTPTVVQQPATPTTVPSNTPKPPREPRDPTETPAATETATLAPTATVIVLPATQTAVPTATMTATVTGLPTVTATATATAAPTGTGTPTVVPTATALPLPTQTPVPTAQPTPAATQVPTATPTRQGVGMPSTGSQSDWRGLALALALSLAFLLLGLGLAFRWAITRRSR